MEQRKTRSRKALLPSALFTFATLALLAGIPSASSDVIVSTAIASLSKKLNPFILSDSSQSVPGTMAAQHQPPSFSSVVFPVYGNVYPLGLYYVSMNIGNPPKPYFLDADTGSDVTWLQCNAPCVSCSKVPHPLYSPVKNRLVSCDDPLCVAVHESTNHEGGCERPSQCDYEIEYQDHGSSVGVLVADVFALPLTNKSLGHSSLAFGCGYDQQGGPSNGPQGRSDTDGVLGLGSGKVSILSQLRELGVCRNVVGHCLSRQHSGFLFFGDDVVPSKGVTWAPMVSGVAQHKYYSSGPASVFLGKQLLSEKQTIVFDSGSSYTYFTNQLYQSLISVIRRDASKTSLKEAPEEKALPMCWKGAKPFSSVLELSKYFGSLILGFANGGYRAGMEIPPENYFIVTKQGNACLGILNANDVGLKDMNLVGDVSMQDVLMVYDNEKQRIGWARVQGCHRLTKFGNSPPP
ncbi:Aspartic proteinase Asp1 [Platanthera guangdongensis]|uniref:Aspartic proteinase Asp1 n=1 Tax=Platanthera guangdongensis TaxID=2320717 RepID=A0ABR2MUA6_9ASPA